MWPLRRSLGPPGVADVADGFDHPPASPAWFWLTPLPDANNNAAAAAAGETGTSGTTDGDDDDDDASYTDGDDDDDDADA